MRGIRCFEVSRSAINEDRKDKPIEVWQVLVFVLLQRALLLGSVVSPNSRKGMKRREDCTEKYILRAPSSGSVFAYPGYVVEVIAAVESHRLSALENIEPQKVARLGFGGTILLGNMEVS